MIDLIINNWETILTVLAVVAVIVFLIVKDQKSIIYRMLYVLCDEAEKLYGSKTGKLKFAYVFERIYSVLPAIIKLFIPYSTLEKWIEEALVELKEFWKEQAEIAEMKEKEIN